MSAGQRIGRRRKSNLIAPVAPPQLTKDAGPTEIDRALSEIADKVNEALPETFYRATIALVTGDNQINHGLLRKAAMVSVAPQTASAAFAWGWNRAQTGPRPLLSTVISVVGGPMTAEVEVR